MTSQLALDGVAKCGHDDLLGFLTNQPCAKCVALAHRKATGKGGA